MQFSIDRMTGLQGDLLNGKEISELQVATRPTNSMVYSLSIYYLSYSPVHPQFQETSIAANDI